MVWILLFYFEIHLSLNFCLSSFDLYQQAYLLDWVDHFFYRWTFELCTFLEHHRFKNHQRFLWEVEMKRIFASFTHQLKERPLCSPWHNTLVCSHLIGSKDLKTDYWGYLLRNATQVEKSLATYEITTKEQQTYWFHLLEISSQKYHKNALICLHWRKGRHLSKVFVLRELFPYCHSIFTLWGFIELQI